MFHRRMILSATLVGALGGSNLLAQSTQPAGPEPGSQGVFVNGRAAAFNADRPGLWLGASVQDHQDFYDNAFDGPNITEVPPVLDLQSAIQVEAVTTVFANLNLGLQLASQQFLAELEAALQNDTTSDPIGENPLDDFFGDISGSGSADGSGTSDGTTDGNTDGTDGQTDGLDDDQIDDFFGPLGAREITAFEDELTIDLFEEDATAAAPVDESVE